MLLKEKRRVALIIETSNSYARGLLHGIRSYTRINKNWSIYIVEHGRGKPQPSWLKNWKGDGIIARIENKEVANIVLESGLPTIDVSAGRYIPNLILVETNDKEITKLAIGHLLSCGLKNFAYCGDDYFNWSKWRRQNFKKITSGLDYKCFEYDFNTRGDSKNGWVEEQIKLTSWIESLPKPIGIMACYDICGQKLSEACRESNITVPDEVAIIGVDNDDLLCDLADPPLSSVIPNTYLTGYKAAQLLEKLMSGKNISHSTHLIEPIGIAQRQSTNIIAVKDKFVAKAIEFIHKNFHKSITVEDCLNNIPVSRRVLERRFYKELNRTPYEEIIRLKLTKVKQLLVETNLPLYLIAEKTGFKHIEYMSSLFKKKIGMPPSHFRVKNRIHFNELHE